jgi:GAF domain-containing protein
MVIAISVGIPVFVLMVMGVFGLYTRRNFGLVLLCLAWGAALSYGIVAQLVPWLLTQGLDEQNVNILLAPLLQYLFIGLGTLLAIRIANFDNLIDGAVYGVGAGLGYAAYENFVALPPLLEESFAAALLPALSLTLVYVTAAGIIGVAASQFYFRHRASRTTLLLSGLGAGVGYTVLYKFLLGAGFGGDIPSAAFGIGGLTLVGLYLTGLLRKILTQLAVEKRRADSLLEIVIPIGVELSTEKDFGRLLEKMLLEAKAFCLADAGTLYLAKGKRLEFAVVRNDALDISMGGTSGNPVTYPPLDLYDKASGEPNHRNLATYVALTGKTVNIEDSYKDKTFDFSGAREFDKQTGYMSISFLTIPLKNNDGEVLGVLQLINALDSRLKELVPFDQNLQQLMESFSSLATAALEGYIQEQSLRNQIKELRIEIDAAKREKQVESITNSDYFKELQKKAKGLKENTEPKK